MYKKLFLVSAYIYQGLMSILVTIIFLILPLNTSNQYSFVVSFCLWLLFILIFYSIPRSIKVMVYDKTTPNPYLRTERYKKDLIAFLELSLVSIIGTLFIFVFMNWAISAYLPNSLSMFIKLLSTINGLIVGAVNFSQYFFLAED